MTECQIQKSVLLDDDMKKIHQYTRRDLSPEEIYTFNVVLCNNDIDRDFEKFSYEALTQMAELFVGRTGIFDHSMKSGDQKARIYDAFVEREEGRKTADGEDYYCLRAKAYMLNNDDNRALINEIEAGIKKEVSVSCSASKCVCSICSADRRKSRCEHIGGKSYSGKLCYSVLSDITDAYEFSFVAVPAQREAGVTKSFSIKEDTDMKDVIKSIRECDNELTLSKSQAMELSSYIEDLTQEARLGEEYKKQLSKEVVRLFSAAFPNVDAKLFSSVASVMTTKELIGFRDGMKKSKCSAAPQPQLVKPEEKNNINFSEFRI